MIRRINCLQNMVSKEVGSFFELQDLSCECVIVVPEVLPRRASQ